MEPNLVNVLILNDKGHALSFFNKKPGAQHYIFPGGKPENNEMLEDAAIREVGEEIGVKVKLIKVIGDYPTFDKVEGDFLCRTYRAEIVRGVPRIVEPKKADQLAYRSYEELIKLNDEGLLAPNLSLMLPDLIGVVD
ncbi:NUDIX hydrolase [Candidatus Pacearchaeota archaeon]|nr:NUDIX hydrolase [Candidatus Pacearchaeota archaeon]